jgi:hypothetical protein
MKRWMEIFVLLAVIAVVAPAQMPSHPMTEENCQMMQKSGDMDKKLQGLVDDMNKAQGQAKVDKMAAVINELVAQRASMQSHMMMMEEDCPMMKKGAAKK